MCAKSISIKFPCHVKKWRTFFKDFLGFWVMYIDRFVEHVIGWQIANLLEKFHKKFMINDPKSRHGMVWRLWNIDGSKHSTREWLDSKEKSSFNKEGILAERTQQVMQPRGQQTCLHTRRCDYDNAFFRGENFCSVSSITFSQQHIIHPMTWTNDRIHQ